MRSTIIFNGKSSDDFGLVVEYFPESVHAARRGELTPIPGRNGVIVREDGSFDSYVQTYQIWFRKTNENPRDTYANARAVAEWLLNARGFLRLEDSYEPEFFRLARYSGSLNVETVLRNHGRATIQFDVQPQRYLKVGDVRIGIDFLEGEADVFVYDLPENVETVTVRSTWQGTVLAIQNINDSSDKVVVQDVEQDNIYVSTFELTDIYRVVEIVTAKTNAETTMFFTYSDGTESEIISIGNGIAQIQNPTQFPSYPLMRFVDTKTEPPAYIQTLVEVENAYIAYDGTIVNASDPLYSSKRYKVCEPVELNSYDYAIVSGSRYAFYDASGNAIFVSDSDKPASAGPIGNYNNVKVIIPSGAKTIRLGTENGVPAMHLELMNKRENPGEAAVKINGTTVNIDFSTHDTIYLDSDLHDAYYTDGGNANSAVSFSNSMTDYPTFPDLSAGENILIPGDGLSLDFQITPRWWTL